MTLEDRVRQAFEPLADQLRSDLSGRIGAITAHLTSDLAAERLRELATAADDARAVAERDVSQRLTFSFEVERTEAIARAVRETREAAERDVTERLTAEFAAEHGNAVAEAQREAAAATERAVTERLSAEFETERLAAVAQAAADAASTAEQSAIERLTAAFEIERADAVAQAAKDAGEKAWARAEREVTDRLMMNFDEAHTRALSEHDAAERSASARLVEAVRALDQCQTLSDVLQALAAAAAAEAARTTLLLVDADGFRGSRSSGFGDAIVHVPQDSAGIVAEAARTAKAVSVASGGVPPSFANLPESCDAVAVPLVLTGRVVGILYADHGGADEGPVRPSWQAALEILGRHAGRVLEALTAARLAEAATGRSMKASMAPVEMSN